MQNNQRAGSFAFVYGSKLVKNGKIVPDVHKYCPDSPKGLSVLLTSEEKRRANKERAKMIQNYNYYIMRHMVWNRIPLDNNPKFEVPVPKHYFWQICESFQIIDYLKHINSEGHRSIILSPSRKELYDELDCLLEDVSRDHKKYLQDKREELETLSFQENTYLSGLEKASGVNQNQYQIISKDKSTNDSSYRVNMTKSKRRFVPKIAKSPINNPNKLQKQAQSESWTEEFEIIIEDKDCSSNNSDSESEYKI